ncbi:UxaA family hydrolase, partial [Micromonospora azadirachtae]
MSLVLLYDSDDVAVATRPMRVGEPLALPGVSGTALRDDVPAGHKVALRDLAPGSPVRKYGQVIGRALAQVRAGEHVHTHNLG